LARAVGEFVQIMSAPGDEHASIKQEDDRWVAIGALGGCGADVALGNERKKDDKDGARAGQIREALPQGRNPGHSTHTWSFGSGFRASAGGVSIAPSLMAKVQKLLEWAIQNDMVTADIAITSGMRDPKRAHVLCVAYGIHRDRIPLEALRALKDGRDSDNNLWYQEGWNGAQIKDNALKNRGGKITAAAAGYERGHPSRTPLASQAGPGVSRHCTGHAIDVRIPWRSADGRGTDVWAWENIYHQFGLTRPLHRDRVKKDAEEWHIEETSKVIDGDDEEEPGGTE
jgi:hypothetical protein